MPSTSVLAMAFFSSGHTGRLPLIEPPQSNVTKLCSQATYCWTIVPFSPLASLYFWIVSSVARGLRRV